MSNNNVTVVAAGYDPTWMFYGNNLEDVEASETEDFPRIVGLKVPVKVAELREMYPGDTKTLYFFNNGKSH